VNSKKIVHRFIEHKTPWFNVVAKDVVSESSSETNRYYMIQPADYVVVLAETPDHRVVFVRQYRPAVEDYTLELPSGHVNPGEEPLATATRELMEETGYRSERVEFLGALAPDTGRLVNRLWCYVAKEATFQNTPVWIRENDVEPLLYPKRDLVNLMASGQLRHAHDLAAIMLAVAKTGWNFKNGS